VQVPDGAVGGHCDDRPDRLARPPGEHLEGDGVEVGLEVVIGEHEVEVAAPHHRVGLLDGAAHPENERHAAHAAEVMQDRVPALRGESRTLLVEDPERQRCCRLPVGGADEPGHEADQGDENFCPAAHDFVGRSAFQCRAK
jgi:hypothetical protein